MDLTTVTSFRRATVRDDLRLQPGETLLGGGTWLLSEPQPGTTGLVDLTTLGWTPVETDGLPADVLLRLAATCTVEQVLTAPWPPALQPLVRQCADAFVMSAKVQRQATVGGNLCLALPAGPMISLLGALGAEVDVWTPDGGERREPVTAFVTGPSTTTLVPGEVVRAIDVATDVLDSRFAFRKTSLAAHGRSAAVVTGRTTPGAVVLTLTASTPRPVVLLVPTADGPVDVATALAGVEWFVDPHGPADWRAAVTAALAGEVLAELTDPGARA